MTIALFAKIFVTMMGGGALWMAIFAQFGSGFHNGFNDADYAAMFGMIIMLIGLLGCIAVTIAFTVM